MATILKDDITNAREQLESYREAINKALEDFFTGIPALLSLELSEQSLDALEKIRTYSLRPGKRLRGALACFAYDYVTGDKYGESGLQTAVALELVQNYLLIVDDVMDKSAVRRGEPTIHELYLAEQPGAKDIHLANMLAINAGLIAQHLVNIALMQVQEDPVRLRQATVLMHKNIAATGFGQIDDACQQVGKKLFSEQDILRKYMLKSSYYTFVNPLQVGLVIAGENDNKTLQEVTRFGLPAGVAFQLQDDILGVFGSSAATGKPNTDDIEEGKYTLLVQYALTHTSGADKAFLEKTLGKSEVTSRQVLRIQKILENSGARKHVEDTITLYTEEAKASVRDNRFWDKEAKGLLTGIVEYSASRQK